MRENEILRDIINYHIEQAKELNANGDTARRRDLLYIMTKRVKQYRELGGKRIDELDIFSPIIDLYNYYYEELIFTPCIEDIKEMQYWQY